jgi:hypothetical protein
MDLNIKLRKILITGNLSRLLTSDINTQNKSLATAQINKRWKPGTK